MNLISRTFGLFVLKFLANVTSIYTLNLKFRIYFRNDTLGSVEFGTLVYPK